MWVGGECLGVAVWQASITSARRPPPSSPHSSRRGGGRLAFPSNRHPDLSSREHFRHSPHRPSAFATISFGHRRGHFCHCIRSPLIWVFFRHRPLAAPIVSCRRERGTSHTPSPLFVVVKYHSLCSSLTVFITWWTRDRQLLYPLRKELS